VAIALMRFAAIAKSMRKLEANLENWGTDLEEYSICKNTLARCAAHWYPMAADAGIAQR
jgi:hypothetical protein